MAKIINTFIGGMSRDISPTKQDNNHLYYAENFRITTQDGLSSAILENEKGNTLTISFSGKDYISHCFMRNDLILFLKNSSANYIYRVDHRIILNQIRDKTSLVLNDNYYHLDTNFLTDDINLSNLVYTGILNLSFSTSRNLITYGRYESPTIQKIYFSDSSGGFRYINIIHNDTYNDLTNGFLDLKSIHKAIINPPTVNVKTGGNLLSGKKQYAVQFYSLYGSETLFSPVSSPVFITSSQLNPPFAYNIKGNDEGVYVNKSVQLNISLSSGDIEDFSRVRVVAIDYTNGNLVPTIRICIDSPINTDELILIDSGESLGTYSIEEFRGLSNFLFTPEFLDSKDDILFAANINEDYFDIGDFDTRAYRFMSTGGVYSSVVYDLNDYLYIISSTGNWTYRATLGGSVISEGTNWSIPETADCINKYNFYNYENNSSYQYKTLPTSSTLGCEGKNIKIEIVEETSIIDSNGSYPKNIFCAFDNNGNPDSGSIGHYLPNEIYRIGIVFRDTYGRRSVNKWICDIRIPENTTQNTTSVVGTNIGFKSYHLKVTVKDFPTGAVSWEIVRCQRKDKDKSILGYGALVATTNLNIGGTNDVQAFADRFFSTTPEVIDIGDGLMNTQLLEANKKVFKFISPDLLFNTSTLESTYNLKIVGLYSNVTYTKDLLDALGFAENTSNKSVGTITKYLSLEYLNGPYSSQLKNIDFITSLYEEPFGVSNGITIPNETRELINNVFCLEGIANYGDYVGQGGKGVLIKFSLPPSFTATNFSGYDLLFGALQRDSYSSMYGGYSYSGRNTSEYIGCYNESALKNTAVDIYGGDTYSGIFSYVHSHIVPDSESPTHIGKKIFSILNIPIECSYNLLLRNDENTGNDINNRGICMIRSNAGSYLANDGHTRFNQLHNLYSYNTSYSRDLDAEKFVSTEDFDIQTKFDCRVHGSYKKTNGELIDSWLKFGVDNYIDVDTKYGPITNLFNYNDIIYFFQEKAFGYLPINEETTVATDTNAKLSLASGGILDRYKYISTESGACSNREILPTKYGIFYIDKINSSLCLYTGSEGNLKDLKIEKGLDSFISSNITLDYSGYIGYNDYTKDVYFSLDSLNKTLVYNTISESFTQVLPFYSNRFIQFNKYLLSKYRTRGLTPEDRLYVHGTGDRGTFYGTTYPSIIQFIVNPQGMSVYDTLEWFSECIGTAKLNKTFSSIRVKTGYQDSGEITLTPFDNIGQRFRTWFTQIPRAVYDLNGNTLERLDGRMSDYYILIELKFDNSDNEAFLINDIITNVTNGNAKNY